MKVDTKKLRALLKSYGHTNTRLADEAGITRQALQAMLREDHVVEVRERTMKGLAQALRLPDVSLLSPDPLMGYKEAVADDLADLTFRGLGLAVTEPRSLDEVYIPVRVSRIPDLEHDHDCKPPRRETDEGTVNNPPLTITQCLALQRRVLIRGEPGSGKTTALRYTARAHAQGLVPEGRYPKNPRVPLFVGLADFSKARERDRDMTLVRFVVTRTLRDASAEYWVQVEHSIELELKHGTCIVLLDGLDEVGGDETLVTVICKFVGDFGNNQFVLTSRIVGLDAGPWEKLGFATFEVDRWRAEDIRQFAQRWYAGRFVSGRKQSKKQLEQRAEAFTAAILGNDSLSEIASNPLMLTILAALHHANATLPRRRVELYAKIVEVMLETWEASKREARPGDPLHGILLEAREFGWLLARLAVHMQREDRLLRPSWWVNEAIQQFLRDHLALDGDVLKEQSERVIRYLCERTGLLVERGDGVFGFWHRTFQEYFAGQGLLLEVQGGGDIVSLLRPYLFHPKWEEVVVYVAAALPALRATSLLRVVLDDPDPTGRFLRRGQRLALRCLVDGAVVADRALLDQIFSDGEAIGKSRWVGISIVLIGLLKQLRVTRYEAEAQRLLTEIEQATKSLPESLYIAFYLSTHDPPNGEKDTTPPGAVCRKRLGGRQIKLVWPAWEKRIEDPDSWYTEVLKSVRDPRTEVTRRIALVSLLGEEAESNEKARRALKQLLARDRLPEIRAVCGEALGEAALADSTIANLLLERLDRDKSDVVRARCAAALRHVAPDRTDVRLRLEQLFSAGPEAVRASAVRGLSHLDFASPNQEPLRERFFATISSSAQPTPVRCACIWAIASLLGRDNIPSADLVIEERLDDADPIVSRVAHHALADAIAEGRKQWSPPLIGKIETTLMAVPDPCPHLYSDLVKILGMKEIRGGQRLERLLGHALHSFADLIKFAFVFGSVARSEQIQESDIDLMIIGAVRLKDLASALHSAEQTLGRTLNPVLFSAEKFREEYRRGNPFLLDVVRNDKIFLKGSRDELTEYVADRSAS